MPWWSSASARRIRGEAGPFVERIGGAPLRHRHVEALLDGDAVGLGPPVLIEVHPLISATHAGSLELGQPSVERWYTACEKAAVAGPMPGTSSPHTYITGCLPSGTSMNMPMLARMARTGAYPGSFDHPTVAHLAVVDAVVARAGLERLDPAVCAERVGKGIASIPTLADRIAVLEQVAAGRTGLGVRVTDARLIVDVVDGYDVVVMGADKWAQAVHPAWYGSIYALDAAYARMPEVYVVPRGGDRPSGVTLLEVDGEVAEVSSTLARAGQLHLMAPGAAAFDARTGVWSDPDRYRAERAGLTGRAPVGAAGLLALAAAADGCATAPARLAVAPVDGEAARHGGPLGGAEVGPQQP